MTHVKVELGIGKGMSLSLCLAGLGIKSHCEVGEMRGYLVSKLYLPFHVPRAAEHHVRS